MSPFVSIEGKVIVVRAKPGQDLFQCMSDSAYLSRALKCKVRLKHNASVMDVSACFQKSAVAIPRSKKAMEHLGAKRYEFIPLVNINHI